MARGVIARVIELVREDGTVGTVATPMVQFNTEDEDGLQAGDLVEITVRVQVQAIVPRAFPELNR